jgi:hypothetical protein
MTNKVDSIKSSTETIYQNIIKNLINEMKEEAQNEGISDELLKEIKSVSSKFNKIYIL